MTPTADRLLIRLASWVKLHNSAEWFNIKEDLEQIASVYKDNAVSYLIKGDKDKAAISAAMAEGVKEVIDRKDFLRDYTQKQKLQESERTPILSYLKDKAYPFWVKKQ